MNRPVFKVGQAVTHDDHGEGTVIDLPAGRVTVQFKTTLQPDPITFVGCAVDNLEPVHPEIVRVLRVIEYVGNREDVEAQVAASIHGEKRFARGCTIKAATIGIYPEVLSGGAT